MWLEWRSRTPCDLRAVSAPVSPEDQGSQCVYMHSNNWLSRTEIELSVSCNTFVRLCAVQLRSNYGPTTVQLRSNYGPTTVRLRSDYGPIDTLDYSIRCG
ncbi:hypothetical protein EYF80_051214 [Liparis tanakae]|uniref:Uncharacterized protein n=1 Tax=Liparis tanakae TaxID=230148 RepID=A0A4Z2FDZ0_9TELE|nr:hypothetical protein EYF80_051214 [Liparis tanakae]